MAALPSYIPLPEAARRLGVPETRMKTMIETGRMKAIEINGEIAVSEESVEKRQPAPTEIKKEDLQEYKWFAELAGVKIGINEAARKYDVVNSTISRWLRNGYIKKLVQDGQKVLVDEQDIAFCAEIYHSNKEQGKWLFNKDGTPYHPKKH